MLVRAAIPKAAKARVLIATASFLHRMQKGAGFKRAFASFASCALGTGRHLVRVHLMQKLALGAFLTHAIEPLATDFASVLGIGECLGPIHL